jgi:hypothetical protein
LWLLKPTRLFGDGRGRPYNLGRNRGPERGVLSNPP